MAKRLPIASQSKLDSIASPIANPISPIASSNSKKVTP
jgi:hypothetical protein